LDTSGNVTELRRDIIQEKGGAYYYSTAFYKDRYVAAGMCGGQFVGIEYDEKDKAWTKSTTETDLRVRISGRELPFEHHHGGSIFAYSFSQEMPTQAPGQPPVTIQLPSISQWQILAQRDPEHSKTQIRKKPGDSATIDSVIAKITPRAETVPLEVKLYPNPTSGPLTIEIDGLLDDYSLYIYDALGRALYSSTGRVNEPRMQTTVDVSRWKPGNYVLVITSGQNRFATKKWIKVGY
jgi:hypothetical protein